MLRKEVVALRSQRSSSPRGQRAQKQPLALKDKPAQKGKGGGKGRGNGKNKSKGGKTTGNDKGEEAQRRIVARETKRQPRNFLEVPDEAMHRSRKVPQRTHLQWLRSSKGSLQRLCVSKQSTERLLLLNFGMPVQLPLSHLRSVSCWSRLLEVAEMRFYRVGQTFTLAFGACSVFFDPPDVALLSILDLFDRI